MAFPPAQAGAKAAKRMQIAIVGGGNFGTAIANIVASNGHHTFLWMRDEQQVADAREHRENRRYLPGHALHELIEPTFDLSCSAAADVIFVSVPSASFREVGGRLAQYVGTNDVLVSATKGIERTDASGGRGFNLMSEILAQETGSAFTGVLSGPNLAEEIANGHFTGTVIASSEPRVTDLVQEILSSPTFRVYANKDVYGVELGGALKNIYAIVCGLAGGIGVGQNTMGMLITRALAEMSRFAVSMGANPFTFLGLAGVGDLMVTCTSPLSRNYQLGEKIATGRSLSEAVEDLGKLAEGVNTLAVVFDQCQKQDIYMPLVAALHKLLHEDSPLDAVVRELMTSAQSSDVDFVAPSAWGGN